MDVFTEYLGEIENLEQRSRVLEVLNWVAKTFPNLVPRVAWNQPMFTDHGTFIIGFSVAKQYMAASPERAGMVHFEAEIAQAGYTQGKMLFRIPWESAVDYALLNRMILFNMSEKAECKSFWRK